MTAESNTMKNTVFIQTPDPAVLLTLPVSPSTVRVNHPEAAAMGLLLAACSSTNTNNARARARAHGAVTSPSTTKMATGGETANYKDYSHLPSHANNSRASASSAPGKDDSFPIKLHQMLSVQDYEEFITWMPHGRSWRVVKPKAFEAKVIPLCFRHTKYASFMRQVNGWGFKRVTQGPDHNSYYHELFLRGLPQLCDKMRRPPKAKRGASSTSSSESSTVDPDFTHLSLIAPLPSAAEGVTSLAPPAQQQRRPSSPPSQHHQLAPPSPQQHHQYHHAYITSTSVSVEGSGSGSSSGDGGSPFGASYNAAGNVDCGGGDDDGGSSGEDKAASAFDNGVRKESNPISGNGTRPLSNGVTFSSASSEYAGGSEGGGDSSSDSGAGSSEDGGRRPNQPSKSSPSSSDHNVNQNNHVYPVMGGGPMLPKQAMQSSSEAPGNMPCIVVQQPQGGNQPQQIVFQQQPQMARVVNQHGDELGFMQLPSNHQGGFSNQMFQNPAMMQGQQNPQFMQGQMLQAMPEATFMSQATRMPQATMQQQQQCMIDNQASISQPQLVMQQSQPPPLQNHTMHQQAVVQQQQMMQQLQQQQQHPQTAALQQQQLFHPQMMVAPGGSGQQFHNTAMGTLAFSHNDQPRRFQEQEQWI